MPLTHPHWPFSVAWVSDRLYKVTADGPIGQGVELDGWLDALDTAWQQLMDSSPEVPRWVAKYLNARGDEHLVVTFGDTSRVVGRRGYGDFGVSYPADLLLNGENQVSAMHTAILTVLDRHVERRSLGIPLLGAIGRVGEAH